MSGAKPICSVSIDEADWVGETGYGGTPSDWQHICDILDLPNSEWDCPHEVVSEDFTKCIFHTPASDLPAHIDESEAVSNVIDSESPNEFLGADFGVLDIQTESIQPSGDLYFAGARFTGKVTLSGTLDVSIVADRAVFQRELSCRDVEFTAPLEFDNVRFEGWTDFTRSSFQSGSSFTGATFADPVVFEDCRFESAQFDESDFQDDAVFLDAEFTGKAAFKQIHIHGDAEFAECSFSDRATFLRSHFGAGADFSQTESTDENHFYGPAIFNNASFEGRADFWNRGFHQEADFGEATFEDRVDFSNAIFHAEAKFWHAQISADCEFAEAIFESEAQFERFNCTGEANMINTQFEALAMFRNCEFGASVDFSTQSEYTDRRTTETPSETVFSDRVVFSESQFHSQTAFSDVMFAANSEFEATVFSGAATFDHSEFMSQTSFQNATFRSECSFAGCQFVSGIAVRKDGSFTTTFFEPPILRDADLSGVDFRDAPLSEAILSNADLTDATLQGADLSYTQLEGALLNRSNCFNVNFTGAALNGSVFGDAQINDQTEFGFDDTGRIGIHGFCIYDQRYTGHKSRANDHPNRDQAAIATYLAIENLAAENGLSQLQGQAFVRRQGVRRQQERRRIANTDDLLDRIRALLSWGLDTASWATMRYGERPRRVVGWWLAVICFSSIVSAIFGLLRVGTETPITTSQLLTNPLLATRLLYANALMFLGIRLPSYHSIGIGGQVVSIGTALSGAVLIALFVFAFGRQAAR